MANQVSGSQDIPTALIEGGKYIRISLKPEIAHQFGLTTKALTDFLKPQLEGSQISKLVTVNKFTPIVFGASSSTKQVRLARK